MIQQLNLKTITCKTVSIIMLIKIIKLTRHSLFFIIAISTHVFSETASDARKIECLLDISVLPSQNFQNPITQYTSMKNDGYPMLLIGIKIHDAHAGEASKKLKSHQFYCSSLIGEQKDVYLSGSYRSQKIDIHIGDQLKLRNIHSSGKSYPYWTNFYWIEKRDE
nr:hypothetical protein [Acinetobacter sp. WCHA55]